MPKRIDLTGQTFGELRVVKLSDKRHKNGTLMWECECRACGRANVYLLGYSLRAGHYKSCGCKHDQKRDAGVRAHVQIDSVEGTRKSALRAKLHAGNKSGHKGVKWLESRQCWLAYIGFRGKQVNLGYHPTKELAIAARKAGEEKYHKPYLEDARE